MKLQDHPVLLLLGSLLVTCLPAKAEFVQTISVRLTARMNGTTNNVGSISSEKMRTVRLTTQDVLRILGTATTNDFTGATLVSVNLGESFQVRRGTNILADVTSFIAETTSEDAHDDVFNTDTGKDNFHGFWIRSFTIDDQAGNRIQIAGLTEERYSASAADIHGNQRISDAENFTGAGTGTLNGDFAVFSGSMVFSGKGIAQP